MSTDLITFDADFDLYQEPATQSVQRIKEIRLSVPLTKADVPLGQFYVWDPNVPQGDDALITPIGESIDVIFLRDAKRLGIWSEEKKGDCAFSSEFRAFTEVVVMFDKREEKKKTIYAIMPYYAQNPDIVTIKKLKDAGDPLLKDVRTRFTSYILWNNEIYRMPLTATDTTGADESYNPLGYSDYAPDSFEGARHICHKETQSKMYLHNITVSSKTISPKSKDRVKTFTVKGLISQEQAGIVKSSLQDLYATLESQMRFQIEKALDDTVPENIKAVHPDIIHAVVNDVKPLLSIGRFPSFQNTIKEATLIPDTTFSDVPEQKKSTKKKSGKDATIGSLNEQEVIAAMTTGRPDIKDVPF